MKNKIKKELKQAQDKLDNIKDKINDIEQATKRNGISPLEMAQIKGGINIMLYAVRYWEGYIDGLTDLLKGGETHE